MFRTGRLSYDQITQYWPLVVEELDRIPQLWTPWWTKEYIYSSMLSQQFQTWASLNGEGSIRFFFLTQIVHYPANRILQLVLGFGNHLEESANSIEDVLVPFALKMECSLCEVTGRLGFAKLLRNRGFVARTMTWTRQVEERVH